MTQTTFGQGQQPNTGKASQEQASTNNLSRMQHGNYFKQGNKNNQPAAANQDSQQHYNKYIEGQIMPPSS